MRKMSVYNRIRDCDALWPTLPQIIVVTRHRGSIFCASNSWPPTVNPEMGTSSRHLHIDFQFMRRAISYIFSLSLFLATMSLSHSWVTTGSFNNLAQPPAHTYHMIPLLIWQRATLAPVQFSNLSEWKELAGSNKRETSLPLCCFSAERGIVVLAEDTKSHRRGKSLTRENEIKKKNKSANQTEPQRNSWLIYGKERQ